MRQGSKKTVSRSADDIITAIKEMVRAECLTLSLSHTHTCTYRDSILTGD